MMEAKSASAPGDETERAPGGTPRTRSHRLWAQGALVLAFALATAGALLQRPDGDPFVPQSGSPSDVFIRGFSHPIERNAHLRLPTIPLDLGAVHFRSAGRGWIAGAEGYLARTEDGGRTWTRGHIIAGEAPRAPAKASSWSVPGIADAHAAEPPSRTADPRQQTTAPANASDPRQQTNAPANATAVRPQTNAPAPPTGLRVIPNAEPAQPAAKEPVTPPGDKAPQATQAPAAKPTENKPAAKTPAAPEPVQQSVAPADPTRARYLAVHMETDTHGVAVGADGVVVETDDGGATWIPRSPARFNEDLYVVKRSSGLWIAAGRSRAIASADGRSWRTLLLPPWRGPATGGRPALGTDGKAWVYASPAGLFYSQDDGQSWRATTVEAAPTRKAPVVPTQNLRAVAHNGRQWLAVGDEGLILASRDGQSWREIEVGVRGDLFDVAAGAQDWLLVGEAAFANARGATAYVLPTADGAKASSVEFRSAARFESASFDGRQWIVVGEFGNVLAVRADATWERLSAGAKGWITDLAWADGRWIAVGGDGVVLLSADGTSWETQEIDAREHLTSVAGNVRSGQGVVVAATRGVFWSQDGVAWQRQRAPLRDALIPNFVAYGKRRFLAADFDGLWQSDDGRAWQRSSTPSAGNLVRIGFSGDRWLVLGGVQGRSLLESVDGVQWDPRGELPASMSVQGLVRDGESVLVTGAGGTVLAFDAFTASAGTTSPRKLDVGTSEDLLGAAHRGGKTVITSMTGNVYASGADRKWKVVNTGAHAPLLAIDANDRRWVAAGIGAIAVSDDGATWKPVRYARYPAGWYWAVCALLVVGAIRLPARLAQPVLRERAPERTIADQAITDAPIRSVREDKLRFGARVDGLSRYLRNKATEPPLTLAINGPWGSGKSSFMRMLQSDLEAHGARTVWFNAWHYQKEEHLQAALLDAVKRQAPPRPWSLAGFEFRARLLWTRIRAKPALALIGIFLAVGAATYLRAQSTAVESKTNGEMLYETLNCIIAPPPAPSDSARLAGAAERFVDAYSGKGADAAGAKTKDGNVAGAARPKAPAQANAAAERCKTLTAAPGDEHWWSSSWTAIFRGELGSGLLVLLVGLVPIVKGLLALRAFGVDPSVLKATLSGPGTRKTLAEAANVRPRFTEEFKQVTKALSPRVITLFIDDLDRCDEKQVMEILEVVNFLVESGDCYVVLGMVEETVQRLVGLAVATLAAELAEQDPSTQVAAHTGGDLDQAKRERRRRFAERYLEKLINIKVDVPALNVEQATTLMQAEARGETAPSAGDAPADAPWQAPWWAKWGDRIVPVLRWVRAPAVVVGVAALAAYLALKFAGEYKEPPAPPVQASARAAAGAAQDVAASPADAGSANASRRGSFVVPLPDRSEAQKAEGAWIHGPAMLVVGAFLLGGLALTALRRPEYHTHDSPAFTRALAIWAPFLITQLKTPRALIRFQNRTRLRAMALDAQAAPTFVGADKAGPIVQWLARRELAQREARRRFNALLPEAYLVALEALRAVLPDLLNDDVKTVPQLVERIDRLLQSDAPKNAETRALTQAIADHVAENQAETWAGSCPWPPSERDFQYYLMNPRAVPPTAAKAA